MVEVRTTDGLVIGDATDHVFENIIADVQTGEEPQIFFRGLIAAVEHGELRVRQTGVGRHDQLRLSGRVADDVAAGVPLIRARGIGARTFRLDVRLLGSKSGHDLHPVPEQRGIGAKERGGNNLVGPTRKSRGRKVVVIRVARPVRRIRLIVRPELLVVYLLLFRHSEIRDALRECFIEETRRAVVVDESRLRERDRARAAIRSDIGVGLEISARPAQVANFVTDVRPDLQREGHAADIEVASEIGVGLSDRVVGFLPVAVGRDERVVIQVGRIDLVAVIIKDRDLSWAQIKNVVETNRDVVAPGGHAVEGTEINILVVDSRVAVGYTRVRSPDWPVVHPAEGGRDRPAGADTAAI